MNNEDKINKRKKSIIMGFYYDLRDSSISDSIQKNSCSCKPSILVVDDAYFMRKVIVDMLKEFWNIDADQASDGDIAV